MFETSEAVPGNLLSRECKIEAKKFNNSQDATFHFLSHKSSDANYRCNMKLISVAVASSLCVGISNAALPPGYEDQV